MRVRGAQSCTAIAVALAAALVVGSAVEGTAQESPRPRPFSTLAIDVGGASVVGEGRLGDWWRARPGVELSVATPFHVGELGLGLLLAGFEPRDAAHPAFDVRAVTLRWSLAHGVGRGVALVGEGRLGSFLMRFDDPDPVEGLTSEQEMIVGGGASLRWRAARRVELRAGATWERVLTSTAFDRVQATAGGRVIVAMPRWLRGAFE